MRPNRSPARPLRRIATAPSIAPTEYTAPIPARSIPSEERCSGTSTWSAPPITATARIITTLARISDSENAAAIAARTCTCRPGSAWASGSKSAHAASASEIAATTENVASIPNVLVAIPPTNGPAITPATAAAFE